MCGIIGYVGHNKATPLLLEGLRRLEYRGYDSAGIACTANNTIHYHKTVGPVSSLDHEQSTMTIVGTTGIGHTRWATHGEPSTANAHPHMDSTTTIALVHNGTIENHSALKTALAQQGIAFASETDTEILAQLIGLLYQQSGDLVESTRQALGQVQGTFGLGIISAHEPHTLIAARRGSPLVIGIGDNEHFIASDQQALAGNAKKTITLSDNELAVLTPDNYTITTIDGAPVQKAVEDLTVTLNQIEKGGYSHFMLKEIMEQPTSLRNTMSGRIHTDHTNLTLTGLNIDDHNLPRHILLFGCGTAWHAGLIGRLFFQELAHLPTNVEYASELAYNNPLIEPNTLAIAISQSGETADTLTALREMQKRGATVRGIVNVVGSSIAREADGGIYLHAGPEIGVASTKAFTAQVTALAMAALYLGKLNGKLTDSKPILTELSQIPQKIEQTLELNTTIREYARELIANKNWLYLGRGVNFPVALEGALKLKEVSYLHAEGLPAAEMKHGPIALIEKGMPVVVIAPRDHLYDKIQNTMQEVHSRGGRLIAITSEDCKEIQELADISIIVPETLPLLSPLLTTIPLQLLAYHAAVQGGHNVDKPRNLAKSVTVE